MLKNWKEREEGGILLQNMDKTCEQKSADAKKEEKYSSTESCGGKFAPKLLFLSEMFMDLAEISTR